MLMTLMTERELDKRLRWPLGRATRLVRDGRLPHILLPDGSLRFCWADIEPLIVSVDPTGEADTAKGGPSHD